MKTSILQSMLAKNKSVILDLEDNLRDEEDTLKTYKDILSRLALKTNTLHQHRVYMMDITSSKWRITRLKKSLAQYAIIQKAIKDEIKGSRKVVAWNMSNGSSISFKSIYYDE